MAISDHPQPRLIRGEPEALTVTAHHRAGHGWDLQISVRRQFQLWGEAAGGRYEYLTTEELVDVIGSAVAFELLGSSSSTGGAAGAE